MNQPSVLGSESQQNTRAGSAFEDNDEVSDEGNDENQPQPTMFPSVNQVNQHNGRHFLNSINVVCPHCSALYWKAERLSISSKKVLGSEHVACREI